MRANNKSGGFFLASITLNLNILYTYIVSKHLQSYGIIKRIIDLPWLRSLLVIYYFTADLVSLRASYRQIRRAYHPLQEKQSNFSRLF